MRSPRFPLPLLAALPLFLTLTACQHPSTLSSIARTERPKLPTRPAELTRTERLPALSGKKSGELVQVDKAWLNETLQLAAAAVGAVARGNDRAGANKLYDRCVAAIMATGAAPVDCPKN